MLLDEEPNKADNNDDYERESHSRILRVIDRKYSRCVRVASIVKGDEDLQ